jgi:hypothetical protein
VTESCFTVFGIAGGMRRLQCAGAFDRILIAHRIAAAFRGSSNGKRKLGLFLKIQPAVGGRLSK